MRARSIANKLGYHLFPGHRIGEWGLGCGAFLGIGNVTGRPVGETRQATSSWHQPHPQNVQEQQLMDCRKGFSVLFAEQTSAHTSCLLSPSVAMVDGRRGAAAAPLQLRMPRRRSVAGSLSIRSFRLGCQLHFEASETVQDLESNVPNEADLFNDTMKQAAMSALKNYLIDVKGASGEDAEFASRNCPEFMAKVAEFAMIHALEKNDSKDLQSWIHSFIEKEDKEVSSEGKPFCQLTGCPTLGDMVQLSKSPLAWNGQGRVLESMAILDSLGWSREALREMLERNPELSTWTTEELQTNICILERVGVKRKDMMSFMEDSSVFTLDLEERLAPLLQYLEVIGIEWDVLGDLLKFNPQGLIKMPLANFRERVDFLLELGLSTGEVERGMRVFPQLVHLRLANLTQKIEYFDGIGVDRNSMVKIVARWPSIFRHSIANNLVPKIHLLESLGVGKSTLGKFIAQYPQFFGCSIENLKQKLAFFEKHGLTGERLVKMITWHPRVFSFSLDDNLTHKSQFLLSKGFVVRSTPMVRALASCITLSTDSMEARFKNLQSFGFPNEEVCELVKKQPTILCLSEKSIRVKMDYLVNKMNRSPMEILKCPGYLLYSLELRVKPRHRVVALLTSKGLLRKDGYSLSTILQPSEKAFVRRFVNLDRDCFDVYLEGARNINGKLLCKGDLIASLGLPESDSRGAGELTASIQDLSFSQKAAAAIT